MKLLRKMIDCESLEIFQENVFDGVSFSKATSLQCSDCNFTTKRTRNRFFLKHVPKTNFIKKDTLRKSILWTSVLIKLQTCSIQLPNLSKKWNSCKTFL